jgi:type II secretory pathway pseudopilin PulG
MIFPPGLKKPASATGAQACAAGFTLLELTLAIALLVLLTAAAVTAFGPWQQQAALGEGTQRVATLLRACQAAAASSGCRVRVVFASAKDGAASPLAVQWEPQPLSEPGNFQPYQGSLAGSADIAGMIRVEGCKLTGPSAYQSPAGDVAKAAETGGLPPVTFYPDGSSDWAKVFLASRYERDIRRAIVEINGTTGTIRATLYADDAYATEVGG